MSDSNSNYLKTSPNWRFDVEAGHYTDEAGETRPNIYGNPRKVKYPTPRGSAPEKLAGNLSESTAAHRAAHAKAVNAQGWADACATAPVDTGEGAGEDYMNLDAHSSGYQFDIGAAPQCDPEVVRPAHYTRGAVECIDAIEAALTPEEYRGYLKGNVLKYFWRERDKGGLQSIQKAEYYTQRLIKLLGEKQDE